FREESAVVGCANEAEAEQAHASDVARCSGVGGDLWPFSDRATTGSNPSIAVAQRQSDGSSARYGHSCADHVGLDSDGDPGRSRLTRADSVLFLGAGFDLLH